MPLVIGNTPVSCQCGKVAGLVHTEPIENTTNKVYTIYKITQPGDGFYLSAGYYLYCIICKSEITRRF